MEAHELIMETLRDKDTFGFHSWAAMLLLVSTVLLTACGSGSSAGEIPPTRTPKPTFTVVADGTLVVSSPTVASSTAAMPAPSATRPPTMTPTPTPTVNPYFNPLTGQMVQDPAVLQRRPLLVRIGNDPQVRPQAGLAQSDMVFEEAMDGWTLTRLTAVVWSQDPKELRPVRSARLFTLELGHMFDGVLVHSGANDQVRWLISQSGLTDLDEYFHPTPYHWLTPQGEWKSYPWMGRVATSSEAIRTYLARKGMEKAVRLAGFSFSAAGDPALQGEPATYIHVPYPRRAVVEYRYDPEKGVYKRFVEGKSHTDALSGQQLAPVNVIVQYTVYQETDVKDVNGAATFNIVSTGEGRAQVFRDGVMIEAKWIRPQLQDFVKFVYSDGSNVPLSPGQTWVEVVPTDYQITYKVE